MAILYRIRSSYLSPTQSGRQFPRTSTQTCAKVVTGGRGTMSPGLFPLNFAATCIQLSEGTFQLNILHLHRNDSSETKVGSVVYRSVMLQTAAFMLRQRWFRSEMFQTRVYKELNPVERLNKPIDWHDGN